MAAPYTDTTALANLVQTAYDRKVRLALRSVPQFRAAATSRVVDQTQPGSTVVFNIHQDLAPATTPLNEITDPAGVSLSNTTPITVTLNEYGNYTVATKRLQEFALDNALDSNIANIIAYNQANSVDKVIESVMATTSNVVDKTGGTTKTISMEDIRNIVSELRSSNVAPFDGVNYLCFLHPRVATDLRSATDAAGWRYPQNYGMGDGLTGLLAGELGTFEGVRFVETPRVGIAGTGASRAYNSYIIGQDALAEAVADEFHVVADGVIVDPLRRKMALGWYGIAGWGLFRPEAMWKVKTTATAGVNA